MPRSGSGTGRTLIVLAILLLVGPKLLSLVPARNLALDPSTELIVTAAGAGLFALGLFLTAFTAMYHRGAADRAFVRTGLGGAKVVIDGGALVLPAVHEVTWVSLRTMPLELTREGQTALITNDCLRANITAAFFIKVPKEAEPVRTAATSLGAQAIDPAGMLEFLETKLESALREVASEMALTELLINRSEFVRRITDRVSRDIASNGLALEGVTIAKLDQTPTSALRAEDNVVDAQGAKKIMEITTAQNIERNRLQLEAQRLIEQEKVRTNQFLYELEVARASAEAERVSQIKVAQAAAEQEAATKSAEQVRLSKMAEVERDRAIELAEVARQQAVEVANQERERATMIARIGKEQALEVANREREIAVAAKETERSHAMAQQLEAEALKTRAEQEVIAVQAAAEAERRANARVIEARAEQEARALDAEGERTRQLVPVEVARAQAEVERTRLKNQSEFESIARDLPLAMARIEAEREVGLKSAEALGAALSQAKLVIYGDPSTLAQVSRAFTRGQMLGETASGFAGAAPPQLVNGANDLAQWLAGLVKHQFGVEVAPDTMKDFIKQGAQGPAGPDAPAHAGATST
ncbi:MAG: hypothetical protein HY332_17410 [Chloroflexi bacterium]|nr:hypothetical protein [Chloroflexota bacterium]